MIEKWQRIEYNKIKGQIIKKREEIKSIEELINNKGVMVKFRILIEEKSLAVKVSIYYSILTIHCSLFIFICHLILYMEGKYEKIISKFNCVNIGIKWLYK